MARSHLVRVATLALAASAAVAQPATSTGSSSQAADGLKTGAASPTSTQAYNTVLINGTAHTFRVLPTLPASIDETQPVLPNLNDPAAVDAQKACPGYQASSVRQNALGFEADLTLAGKACNVYGTDISDLVLAVQYQSDKRLSVKISPKYLTAKNSTQYYIDPNYVKQPVAAPDAAKLRSKSDLEFHHVNSPSFGFAVTRKSTGDVLFDTRGKKLVFENQFVEFATALDQGYNLYGLGEHIHAFRLGNTFNATIYAADAGDPVDANIYGSHPVYVDTRYFEKGSNKSISAAHVDPAQHYESRSHGVYLRNAHGQEVLMRQTSLTWRLLGGSIDLYFLDGPSAVDVIQDYQQSAIGLPAMQQYWTFGFHQCRWGYANVSQLQEVVDQYRAHDIPLETIWSDIDYMYAYRDFTTDPIRFAESEFKAFLAKLQGGGQHYVPIVDSAIYIPNPVNASDAYAVYDRGNDSDVFLRTADGQQYVGAVWPGLTVFPDWTAPKAVEWWTNELYKWYQSVAYSGIWIDMSEVSSFCVGSCGTGRLTENQVHPPFGLPGEKCNLVVDYPEGFNVTNSTQAASASRVSAAQSASCSATATASSSSSANYLRTTPTPGVRNEAFPPYAINNVNGALPVHAVSPNATHSDGSSEYDMHNLFGHQILNATYQALAKVFPGKRPFIIGRSTFAGSGRYAGHWGGDNKSKFSLMAASIPQALSFSIFGMPMFGVDTCGFDGNSDYELCSRWMQLSAFFPFYRNHNTLSAAPQEAYVWQSTIEASKAAMRIRYALLPYLYTLFEQAHTKGSTVMRALAWEFPQEPWLASADRQFLLGPSILVTPVLTPGATTVQGVFPGAAKGTLWYDWYSLEQVQAKAAENKTLAAPLGHIPVFIRGGSALALQQPGYTTAASRKQPWEVLVALGSDGAAQGELYLDDGESVQPNATRRVTLEARGQTVCAQSTGTFRDANSLASITVLGVRSKPARVLFNGQTTSFGFNETSRVLAVQGLQRVTGKGAWTDSWTLSWNS